MEILASYFPYWLLLVVAVLLLICGGTNAIKTAVSMLAPDPFIVLWKAASRAFALLSFAVAIAALSLYAEKSLLFTAMHSLFTFVSCVAFGACAGMFTNRLNQCLQPARNIYTLNGALIVCFFTFCYWVIIRLLELAARNAIPVS